MADLLECLLQIRGLRETAERLAALGRNVDAGGWTDAPSTGAPTAADLLALWIEIEMVHGVWLRLMLASPRVVLPAFDEQGLLDVARRHRWQTAGEAIDRFVTLRRDTLGLLDRCSAADLARTALHAARREMTVADLVAQMLASDVERFGEIRRTLKRSGE